MQSMQWATSEVTSGELEIVVLIPVFQRQCWQWCCIGELQISKVPVQDLSITRRQVDIAGKKSQQQNIDV